MPQPTVPEDYLSLAQQAPSPRERADLARSGLGSKEITNDTQALLLRQLYLAQLEMGELGAAVESAQKMVETGALPEVAHHDAARALEAIGDRAAALRHQRLASRACSPRTRSFHLWSLATLQFFDDDAAAALDTLERAARWASRDGVLIRAHQAHVQLTLGEVPLGLDDVLSELKESPARRGYGGYLLGMLGYQIGDTLLARQELRAFLRRTASVDTAKAITLAEELKRARQVLAELELE